ncbi:MAG: aminodeoxychorismate lyase [Porticoccaceae bacterium]
MNSVVNSPEILHSGPTTINGVEADSLPVADRGTNYGHGLFETMLLSAGEIPLWQCHSSRLMADAPALGLSISKDILDHNLEKFLTLLKGQSLGSGIVKLMVTAGTGGRGYASPEKLSPQVICQFSPLPENLFQSRREGIALTQCQYRLPANPLLAGIKHLNRLDQVLARAEWGDEYADGLMFSQQGILVEATSANIFIKTADSGWLTPVLDQAGVRGVMRGLLLERLFNQAGLQVSEGTIGPQQLATASELFICSSVRGLLPVTEIKNIGHWSIGPDTKRLQSALFDLYDCYPC